MKIQKWTWYGAFYVPSCCHDNASTFFYKVAALKLQQTFQTKRRSLVWAFLTYWLTLFVPTLISRCYPHAVADFTDSETQMLMGPQCDRNEREKLKSVYKSLILSVPLSLSDDTISPLVSSNPWFSLLLIRPTSSLDPSPLSFSLWQSAVAVRADDEVLIHLASASYVTRTRIKWANS